MLSNNKLAFQVPAPLCRLVSPSRAQTGLPRAATTYSFRVKKSFYNAIVFTPPCTNCNYFLETLKWYLSAVNPGQTSPTIKLSLWRVALDTSTGPPSPIASPLTDGVLAILDSRSVSYVLPLTATLKSTPLGLTGSVGATAETHALIIEADVDDFSWYSTYECDPQTPSNDDDPTGIANALSLQYRPVASQVAGVAWTIEAGVPSGVQCWPSFELTGINDCDNVEPPVQPPLICIRDGPVEELLDNTNDFTGNGLIGQFETVHAHQYKAIVFTPPCTNCKYEIDQLQWALSAANNGNNNQPTITIQLWKVALDSNGEIYADLSQGRLSIVASTTVTYSDLPFNTAPVKKTVPLNFVASVGSTTETHALVITTDTNFRWHDWVACPQPGNQPSKDDPLGKATALSLQWRPTTGSANSQATWHIIAHVPSSATECWPGFRLTGIPDCDFVFPGPGEPGGPCPAVEFEPSSLFMDNTDEWALQPLSDVYVRVEANSLTALVFSAPCFNCLFEVSEFDWAIARDSRTGGAATVTLQLWRVRTNANGVLSADLAFIEVLESVTFTYDSLSVGNPSRKSISVVFTAQAGNGVGGNPDQFALVLQTTATLRWYGVTPCPSSNRSADDPSGLAPALTLQQRPLTGNSNGGPSWTVIARRDSDSCWPGVLVRGYDDCNRRRRPPTPTPAPSACPTQRPQVELPPPPFCSSVVLSNLQPGSCFPQVPNSQDGFVLCDRQRVAVDFWAITPLSLTRLTVFLQATPPSSVSVTTSAVVTFDISLVRVQRSSASVSSNGGIRLLSGSGNTFDSSWQVLGSLQTGPVTVAVTPTRVELDLSGLNAPADCDASHEELLLVLTAYIHYGPSNVPGQLLWLTSRLPSNSTPTGPGGRGSAFLMTPSCVTQGYARRLAADSTGSADNGANARALWANDNAPCFNASWTSVGVFPGMRLEGAFPCVVVPRGSDPDSNAQCMRRNQGSSNSNGNSSSHRELLGNDATDSNGFLARTTAGAAAGSVAAIGSGRVLAGGSQANTCVLAPVRWDGSSHPCVAADSSAGGRFVASECANGLTDVLFIFPAPCASCALNLRLVTIAMQAECAAALTLTVELGLWSPHRQASGAFLGTDFSASALGPAAVSISTTLPPHMRMVPLALDSNNGAPLHLAIPPLPLDGSLTVQYVALRLRGNACFRVGSGLRPGDVASAWSPAVGVTPGVITPVSLLQRDASGGSWVANAAGIVPNIFLPAWSVEPWCPPGTAVQLGVATGGAAGGTTSSSSSSSSTSTTGSQGTPGSSTSNSQGGSQMSPNSDGSAAAPAEADGGTATGLAARIGDGGIAGIVVGVLAGVALVGAAVYFVVTRVVGGGAAAAAAGSAGAAGAVAGTGAASSAAGAGAGAGASAAAGSGAGTAAKPSVAAQDAMRTVRSP